MLKMYLLTCTPECSNNTWVLNCSKPCGHCASGFACNTKTGHCLGHCEKGLREPPLCYAGNGSMMLAHRVVIFICPYV